MISEYVKTGRCSVKVLKDILDEFDDDTIVKFQCCNTDWDLGHYMLKNDELIFSQSSRKVKEMSDRFFADHTTRKGSWIEDRETGHQYFICNREDVQDILSILNDFNNQINGDDCRFVTYSVEKKGRFVQDMYSKKEFNLGDSTSVGFLRDALNEYDYQVNGYRELKYNRTLM